MSSVFTLGDLERRSGIPEWKWRKIYQAGILPEPGRVGGKRVVTLDELPALEQAMIKRGYMRPNQPAMAS